MDKITNADLVGLFESVGNVMAENAELLCEMDARMGDGDLGLTMNKGFGAIPSLLSEIDEPDIGKRLAKTGMKMTSVVPSTMGTLMGSGIMSGGKAIAGCGEIGAAEFAKFLSGFADGIAKRGKCSPGDRTVLDAVYPAANRTAKLLEDKPSATLTETVKAAYEGACEGLAATKDMTPKFGKAAVFAGRASGVEDQGAYAGMLMIKGYLAFIS